MRMFPTDLKQVSPEHISTSGKTASRGISFMTGANSYLRTLKVKAQPDAHYLPRLGHDTPLLSKASVTAAVCGLAPPPAECTVKFK